jgi:hypothetical protein
VLQETPIANVPQTKPSPPPAVVEKVQDVVQEQTFDWAKYHGFKKNPILKPYIIR